MQFAEKRGSIEERINVVVEAVSQLKNSAHLPKLLQLVLSLGNHLNAGTKKGQAAGFRMSSLIQLSSTKSVDNKTTALRVLATILRADHMQLLCAAG